MSKTVLFIILLHLLVDDSQALDFESVGEKIMKKIGKQDSIPFLEPPSLILNWKEFGFVFKSQCCCKSL